MDNKKSRVLIIEDDPDIVALIEIHLGDLGLELQKATDGRSGLEMALAGDFALIILDLMLPEMDGIEVCKKFRARNQHTPILMLTAKSEEFDKVLGLELGADDYLTKPFSIRELIARIKAIIRRMEAHNARSTSEENLKLKRFDELTIDFQKRKVLIHDKKVELTAKEFELLSLFAQNPGRAYSRKELLDLVWGYHFDGYDHTVNSHINRLRAKIEQDPAAPKFIKTVWGMGYRFIDEEELHS